ncbi:aldehyde dehydrogenase [Polyporus arcularius HHB13444]|uniref:Aldehyde dehydrogenase n=1 Tax=Polyporus arcularius HHB13444 TaxID=1314778 RepID=A0A5C3PPK4_9APHY|nr:aldehyde dehydrogenase [Polyporus arcularius HHB13444]
MSEQYTPLDDIPRVLACARNAFLSDRAKPVAFRKQQIAQVGYLLKDNEERFKEALKLDLGRHAVETELFDFGPTYKDVRVAYDNVEKWTKVQPIDFNLNYIAMRPTIKAEPKGVILIVSAFNVPLFLTLGPLVSAIASGCAAVIKPSEAVPHVNLLLAELIPKYLDPELYHVIQGGVAETSKILELRWDHILYIGGERVGRIIAQAAAKHLTPITLELGGKNPVVVDPKVDIEMTARRLLWGRFSNAGQVCTCPEYVLVPRTFQSTLISALKDAYGKFYPDGPENSDSFSRIVTREHAARLQGLLKRTNGEIVCGGDVDVEKKYVAPTIVNNVTAEDALMGEEMFGPVLLIVPVEDVDEAIAFIQARETPLAVYVFSQDKKFQEKVFSSTRSGAALANETVLSPAVPGFPVGGVGASGYGYYAGKQAFEQFTHYRVSLDNPSWVDTLVFGFRFPPYNDRYKKYVRMMHAPLPPRPTKGAKTTKPGFAWTWWISFVVSMLVSTLPLILVRKNDVLRKLRS